MIKAEAGQGGGFPRGDMECDLSCVIFKKKANVPSAVADEARW